MFSQGYYLLPKGPHSSIYCDDRNSVWEIRTIATEMFLEHHYSPNSVIIQILNILNQILIILKGRGVKTLNKQVKTQFYLKQFFKFKFFVCFQVHNEKFIFLRTRTL